MDLQTILFGAQQLPASPPAAPLTGGTWEVLKVIAGVTVGVLGLGGFTVILVRGFWAKSIEPMIWASVTTWYNDKPQSTARHEATISQVQEWYTSDAVRESREKALLTVMDNQIRRDDGLINKEIHTKVKRSADALTESIAELQRRIDARDAENRKFQTEVLDGLRDLQQSVSFLHGQQAGGQEPGAAPRHPAVPVRPGLTRPKP